MKKTAQVIRNVLLVVVFINVAALVFSKNAWAASGNVQICQKNSTCVVGEFLYDDSYVPITNASCSFNSKYPNGDVFVNSQPMTSASANDGWYSYDVIATGSAGTYRSTICCTAGADYLCLDKSFEVATASSTLTKDDVSDSVWNAPRASYTASGSFGETLQNIIPSVNDIIVATWGYSNRSLSTFGSLTVDIWNNATRLLTGANLNSGSLATKSDVDDKVNTKTQELKDEIKKTGTGSTDISDLKKITQRTNNLLEKLVNKPIIETSVEDVPDLQAKLKETDAVATQLFIGTQYSNSKAGLIKLKWNSLENSEVLDSVQELTRRLGGENDSSSSGSVFGYISYLKESWDWTPTETIKTQARAIREVLVSIQREVESSGKSRSTYNKVITLVNLFDQLDTSIGDNSNKVNQKTLFGKLKETKLLAGALDDRSKDFEAFLDSWNSYKLPEKQRKLSELSKEVVAVNRIPSINKSLLSANSSLEKELRNKSYFVMGIISANKKLLARKTGLTLTSTWLELGSIIFKTLVTNPSTLISQKATLKYYLPPEIKEEDIIEADSGLTIKYDTEKNQYYVSGEFLLAPSETKTISVRTQDIWIISKEEVDSLRKQAEELSRPLEKTSYFAQGVTIKSDIDVSLDKILNLMKDNGTPEIKIRAYREAQIEMKAISGKMDKLKELVTQASSTGTMFGFVGGTQTLAVWGLIIILTVGFVFLALYMKVLVRQEEKGIEKKLPSQKKKKQKINDQENDNYRPISRFGHTINVAFIIFGIGSSLAAGVMLGRTSLTPNSQPKVVTGSQANNSAVLSASASASQADVKLALCENEKKKAVRKVKVIVPLGSAVNVRSGPTLSSLIITKLKKSSEFTELDRKDGWVQIEVKSEIEGVLDSKGWVSEEFIEKQILGESEKLKNDLATHKNVIVNDTSTGFLRVRQIPWGQEISKVYPGDKLSLIEEKEDWLKVSLQNGTLGWIYKEYVTKSSS